jgi:catechol 2,3-dioxygenase-like lactoylglutathione lyase family enzyme
MARVTGIGGIFFKARDPEALRAWYRRHLDLDTQEWGGVIFRSPGGSDAGEAITVWNIFPGTSDYFGPGSAQYMINYRVDNLADMLAKLRNEGCTVDERIEESQFGKFGWAQDPEGNRLELWEPPAGGFPG